MSEHYERADYVFTSGNGAVTVGAIVLDSRAVRCLNGDDGTIAWTNLHRTRREARARFEGDLRAMRRNDCYAWAPAGGGSV